MKRITMSLDDDLADAFEAIVLARGYQNRSEAFRDLLRAELGQVQRLAQPDGPCIATLSYVYNHHQRQLAMRLTDMQHEHHALTVSTTHAHLDHEMCVEVAILRGPSAQVQTFAQSVMAQPGVSHGQLHLVPLPGATGSGALPTCHHAQHGDCEPDSGHSHPSVGGR